VTVQSSVEAKMIKTKVHLVYIVTASIFLPFFFLILKTTEIKNNVSNL
jgi:hypothetical protein